jgi:putative nucleotidyltransferase with HDIG domain
MQAVSEPTSTRPWALEGLPPFPPVAMRVLQVLSQEDAVLRQLAELIRMDPAFSAEILRLANSAAFGFSARIDNLGRAIVLLGTERVRALTMTVALGIYTKHCRNNKVMQASWSHTLATAFLSEMLAQACALNRDRAYTAGLMHDIGRLGLLVAYPAEYENLTAVAVENSISVLEVERGMFDIDHCEAGRWLAKDWNFPVELQETIGTHHNGWTPSRRDLNWVLQIACSMADTLGFQVIQPCTPIRLPNCWKNCRSRPASVFQTTRKSSRPPFAAACPLLFEASAGNGGCGGNCLTEIVPADLDP